MNFLREQSQPGSFIEKGIILKDQRKGLKKFINDTFWELFTLAVFLIVIVLMVSLIWRLSEKEIETREGKNEHILSEKEYRHQEKVKSYLKNQIAWDKARIIEIEKMFNNPNMPNMNENAWSNLYHESEALRNRIKAGESIGMNK